MVDVDHFFFALIEQIELLPFPVTSVFCTQTLLATIQ